MNKVYNATSASFQPGIIVAVQLGTPDNTRWSPCASVLLLANERNDNLARFVGYAKFDDEPRILLDIVPALHDRQRELAIAGNALGYMYSVASIRLSKMHEYLDGDVLRVVIDAIKTYHAIIDELPVTTRLRGNGKE